MQNGALAELVKSTQDSQSEASAETLEPKTGRTQAEMGGESFNSVKIVS